MTHLTEVEIQELIETLQKHPDAAIPGHVKSCPYCQQQIDLYHQIHRGLSQNQEQAAGLSSDFSMRVIMQIEKQEQVFRRNMLFLLSFCSLVFIAGIGLSVYLKLISLNPVLAPFETILSILQKTMTGTVVNPLKSTFQTKLSLVMAGGLVLFMTALIDKLWLQPKLRLQHHIRP